METCSVGASQSTRSCGRPRSACKFVLYDAICTSTRSSTIVVASDNERKREKRTKGGRATWRGSKYLQGPASQSRHCRGVAADLRSGLPAILSPRHRYRELQPELEEGCMGTVYSIRRSTYNKSPPQLQRKLLDWLGMYIFIAV